MTEDELYMLLIGHGVDITLDPNDKIHVHFINLLYPGISNFNRSKFLELEVSFRIKKTIFSSFEDILYSNSSLYLERKPFRADNTPTFNIKEYMDYYNLLGISIGQYILNNFNLSDFKSYNSKSIIKRHI